MYIEWYVENGISRKVVILVSNLLLSVMFLANIIQIFNKSGNCVRAND